MTWCLNIITTLTNIGEKLELATDVKDAERKCSAGESNTIEPSRKSKYLQRNINFYLNSTPAITSSYSANAIEDNSNDANHSSDKKIFSVQSFMILLHNEID